jgi:hypothetical protein
MLTSRIGIMRTVRERSAPGGKCREWFRKGDLWVLEDKNDMGAVFDWIVDFSVLCLYSLYLFLLILICFCVLFFLLTFRLNLSG